MTVVLVIAALLLANALFVAAEFALVGAPTTGARTSRAARATAMARRVLGLLTSPCRQDRYIATAQLGITLASLGLGMYGEHTLADCLEPRARSSGDRRRHHGAPAASILAIGAY